MYRRRAALAGAGMRMSAQPPSPGPRVGRRRPSLVIGVVFAFLVMSPAVAMGQTQAPEDGGPTEAEVALTGTPTEPIPLTSLEDPTSLEATVTLSAAGSLGGEEMAGDLSVQLVADEQQQYRIDITGDLLGPIAAQVGGKLAAQASSEPAVQAFGASLREAGDADIYIDSATGYPLRYESAFSGAYEPVDLDGDFSVRLDLTKVGTDSTVTLPKACARPISM